MSITSESTLEVDLADLDEKSLLGKDSIYQLPKKRPSGILIKTAAALMLSCVFNIVMITKVFTRQATICPIDAVTPFARLERNKPVPFMIANQNESYPDALWDSWNVDTGSVALSDEYAKAMGIPLAQRWPWDFSKGIYYLQAHHQMHCIKMIRQSLADFRAGRLQSEHPLHIDHCMTAIVEDIVCNADDTPRYTGGHFETPGSGVGQHRQCRDWDKLNAWALQRSACYEEGNDPFDLTNNLDRYKHCPDGSRPWEGAQIWKTSDPESAGELFLNKDTKL